MSEKITITIDRELFETILSYAEKYGKRIQLERWYEQAEGFSSFADEVDDNIRLAKKFLPKKTWAGVKEIW